MIGDYFELYLNGSSLETYLDSDWSQAHSLYESMVSSLVYGDKLVLYRRGLGMSTLIRSCTRNVQ